MITLFAVLFGYSVLVGASFLLVLGRPWRHSDRAMAWLLSGAAVIALTWDLAWFLALLGVVGWWSQWVLGLSLAAQDAFFTWRLWLVLRAKRRP